MSTMTMVWVLIAFIGTEIWPGATSQHQVPETYSTKVLCEKGKEALLLTNTMYVKKKDPKDTWQFPEWKISYAICVEVPVKQEEKPSK